MATDEAKAKKPLWLLIEECILKNESQVLSGGNPEASIQQMAGELDETGYNVSHYGGNLITLRFAVTKARKVGRPLLKDLNAEVSTLSLEDVADPFLATTDLLNKLGETWPELKSSACRPDVVNMIEQTKLNLLIAKAKSLKGDEGIRLLIAEEINADVIIGAMEITADKLKQVNAEVAAERAERARVTTLLEKVADKSNAEKVRHLFDNNVSEALIVEIAKVSQGDIDAVKKAMEEEIKEKERLTAEEAARKKKAAEGPSLDDMTPDEMLGHIESIREIMEFSEEEKEIRVMCEQSSIPKALVDIAVSDPAKLDELEQKAQG